MMAIVDFNEIQHWHPTNTLDVSAQGSIDLAYYIEGRNILGLQQQFTLLLMTEEINI